MPSPVRLARVIKLLDSKGYTLTKISGSHHKFSRPGHPPISIPVHRGEVKYVYFKIIEKLP